MKKWHKLCSLTVASLLLLSGTCLAAESESALELNIETKEATQFTIDANEQVYALLDFEDDGCCCSAIFPDIFRCRCIYRCEVVDGQQGWLSKTVSG